MREKGVCGAPVHLEPPWEGWMKRELLPEVIDEVPSVAKAA
jgi:hypothetical protein